MVVRRQLCLDASWLLAWGCPISQGSRDRFQASACLTSPCCQVTLESDITLRKKHRHYCRLRDALGCGDAQLAACLAPPSRAMLGALLQGERCSAVGEGDAKLTVAVRRERAFWDAFEEAARQGVVPEAAMDCSTDADPWSSSRCGGGGGDVLIRGRPCKIFPRFVHTALAAAAAGAAAADEEGAGAWDGAFSFSGVGGAGVEAGEGHGPRKEFFELAGTGMTQGQRPAERRQGERQHEQQHVQPSGGWEGAGARGVGPLFVQVRATGHFWLNPQLEEAGDAKRALWFAGWLMAQALPNRAALGLRLSPALFEKLVAGPGFLVRAERVGVRLGLLYSTTGWHTVQNGGI